MMSQRKITIDIPGEWLAQWAAVIRATHEATRYEERVGQALHVGDGDVSVRVVPDGYSTSADGRDWAGGGISPVVGILSYDDCYSPSDTERHLKAAVQALYDLPSGMGWAHGEVVVSVRTCPRKGKRSVLATWTVAKVAGRGITYVEAPEVNG